MTGRGKRPQHNKDGNVASVNDLVIKIATVNGTGSASANGLLMKSIFRMGVPVVGKNYFPSNIQGLPTWYEIRVTGDGYQARSDRVDLMLAMNAQTYARDLAEVTPGGWLLYDSTWPRSKLLDRDDERLGHRHQHDAGCPDRAGRRLRPIDVVLLQLGRRRGGLGLRLVHGFGQRVEVLLLLLDVLPRRRVVGRARAGPDG